MASLRCIVYVSTAVRLMSELDLEALLIEARDLNLETGTTGVLLYSEGSFMQYFEGTEEAVKTTYQRIRDSRKHTGLLELMNEAVAERCFADWQMGFARASRSQLLRLSTAQWRRRVLAPSAASASPHDGLALLLDFWARSGR